MAFFLLYEIRSCYSVIFENVRFQPSSHKYAKAAFSKFWSPGYVLKEAQPPKTNKLTLGPLKKIAKDTYTCEQELTQINASEKENKYTGSKEKYSS